MADIFPKGRFNNVDFSNIDVSNTLDLKNYLKKGFSNRPEIFTGKIVVYIRLLINFFSEKVRTEILENISEEMPIGSLLAIEFINEKHIVQKKSRKGIFRRINQKELIDKLKSFQYTINQSVDSKEFSVNSDHQKFLGNDPFLGRIIAQK